MKKFLKSAEFVHSELGTMLEAFKAWRIWYFLGKHDILQRYRGSLLGPFWITISTAITVVSMGCLYGILFGIERSTYLPYFATGMIIWNFIAMVINESTKVFQESKPYMENVRLPCAVYIFRLIFRNLIVLLHTLPVYMVVAYIYKIEININILSVLPGLLIIGLNGLFYGTLIAFISTRYPDMGTMVSSILQVIFFITPIMWSPENLPARFQAFLYFNPFYYFVNLLRNPLLGITYSSNELTGIAIITLLGLATFLYTTKTYSQRVIFWI